MLGGVGVHVVGLDQDRRHESVQWIRETFGEGSTFFAVEYDQKNVPGVSLEEFAGVIRSLGFEADSEVDGKFVHPDRTIDKVPSPNPEPTFDQLFGHIGVPSASEPLSVTNAYDPVVEPEPEAEPEGDTKTKKRRRRCKVCGVLVEPDDVDTHAAEHESE